MADMDGLNEQPVSLKRPALLSSGLRWVRRYAKQFATLTFGSEALFAEGSCVRCADLEGSAVWHLKKSVHMGLSRTLDLSLTAKVYGRSPKAAESGKRVDITDAWAQIARALTKADCAPSKGWAEHGCAGGQVSARTLRMCDCAQHLSRTFV